jgi:hypothetical protein
MADDGFGEPNPQWRNPDEAVRLGRPPTPTSAITKRYVPERVANAVLADAVGCTYCGDRLVPLQVEHRRPLSRGGSNARDNLVAACVSCNMSKRALLLHEWRGYRHANGMPWPPLATHATDPVHYGDDCDACKGAYWQLTDDLGPSFTCVPVELRDSGSGLLGVYRCPLGHRWTCWWAWDRSYYSDCPCGHCVALRADNGDQTYEARPPYTSVPEVFAAFVGLP